MNLRPIPGQPLPDNLINPFYTYDFGPAFGDNDLTGAMAVQPPPTRGMAPMLVPRTDAGGNEIAGVPSVLHQATLGPCLGCNVTAAGYLMREAEASAVMR